jgi:hypothetical protein
MLLSNNAPKANDVRHSLHFPLNLSVEIFGPHLGESKEVDGSGVFTQIQGGWKEGSETLIHSFRHERSV